MTTKPVFRPHPLFLGGHLQTLAGFYWPTKQAQYRSTLHLLDVPGGDKIALHDDCPPKWSRGDRVVLLIHGLAGCHGSGYMARLCDRLHQRHIRCFRMDMRGTGASAGLAILPGHAGRTEDAAIAIHFITNKTDGSPITLVGFSMGGNIALGTTARATQEPMGTLKRCIAICPPIDLSLCCRQLRIGTSKFYDRYLVRFLIRNWLKTGGQLNGSKPKSIYEFDDRVTAPLSGFEDAEDYYAQCSSGPRLKHIRLPTILLAAKNDPVVSYEAIENAEVSSSIRIVTTDSGGHLGYFCSRRDVPDHRWMDWQISEWVDSDWTANRLIS